jgi:hypothetical protein
MATSQAIHMLERCRRNAQRQALPFLLYGGPFPTTKSNWARAL